MVNYSVSTTSSGFGGSSNTVDVEIYGYDFNTTTRLADEVSRRIGAINGAEDIQISRKKEKPELQVVLDRNKLAMHGLNSATVSSFIRNRVQGMTASRFREEGDEYDIIVRLTEDSRNSITDLEELTIVTPKGEKIKLKELGEVKEFWSPPNIQRKRKERVVTVSAKPVGVPLGTLARSDQDRGSHGRHSSGRDDECGRCLRRSDGFIQGSRIVATDQPHPGIPGHG